MAAPIIHSSNTVVPSGKSSSPIQKANILLVDDRDDKRLAMQSIIADLNQNIILASSGRDALRHLLHQEFAVILLDVNMPVMDGFETALLIRQKKSLEHVPIIFISAISDTETHLSRGYSLGAVDYILAPIIPEILRAKVSVFVELFKATNQVKQQAEDLRQAHDGLEHRVKERTAELAVANEALEKEIKERKRAEESLRQLNNELEHRVRERTTELSTANEEMEAFTYSIAHDLRAPFRQIHAYTEILQEDFSSSLPAQARDYIRRIRTKAKDMGQMTDDLLNLFGIAKQKVDFHDADLEILLKEVIEGGYSEIAGRSIEWKIGKLPVAPCNPALTRQVFDNLLSNAVKYSRFRNPARIEVGILPDSKNAVFFVRDNGVGFDMKNSGKLFGVFQRMHRAEEFEGTGVGLALVSRIVRKHGGMIWAEAQIDKGATFYFTLGPLDSALRNTSSRPISS